MTAQGVALVVESEDGEIREFTAADEGDALLQVEQWALTNQDVPAGE